MKRQAGPREPESRGVWGPGEKPSIGGARREAVHEWEGDRVGRVGFLTGGDEKREGERATERSGGGVEIYGRPRGRRGASLGRGSSEVV